MIAGPIKSMEYFHESKEAQLKVVAVGDAGPGGVQAVAMRAGNGMACGDISGSAKGLICSAHTHTEEQKVKTKLYSGGEAGEILMHEGTPFSGQGQILDRFPGDYINGMVLCNATNRLYVITSSKKIAVYSTETQEKVCQVDDAHSKGIYGIALYANQEVA